jgi:hypothetical protein
MALRVALLSSWNTRCGIAEYSRQLAFALKRQPDVEVSVLGSRNFGERAVREYESWATPVFDVRAWTALRRAIALAKSPRATVDLGGVGAPKLHWQDGTSRAIAADRNQED